MLGIYTDLPINEYHGHTESVSRSGIVEFRKSPYHYWSNYLNPDRPRKEETDAMIFGNAYHTMILEPDEFPKRYAHDFVELEKLPKMPLLKAVGREVYDAEKKKREDYAIHCERLRDAHEVLNRGKQVLSNKDMNILLDMKAALKADEEAYNLVTDGLYEQSIFWRDPHTDILCKARPDIWHDNMIGDLKTIKSADERTFQRAVVDYGYHIAAAMIREGIRETLEKDIKTFVFLAAEKTFPYCVVPYILDPVALEIGHIEFKNALVGIKACREKNEWRRYEAKTISLPAWYA